MVVWIVEDEAPAARRIVNMLQQEPDCIIEKIFETVEDTTAALQNNAPPDLMVMDIHLADGSSFEIFRQITVTVPVIFTTAYDAYAIEAFKVNSIDYLLKPIKQEELINAVNKFKKLNQRHLQVAQIEQLLKSVTKPVKDYKKRFVVRYGEHLKTIDISQVAYFFTENKITFLVTKEGSKNMVDYNMDQLDTLLDPKIFFRINRQYIIGIHAIAEMFSYSKSRVLIKLNPPAKHETIVSTERSGEFKQWLDDQQ